jgi:hypothetical protein
VGRLWDPSVKAGALLTSLPRNASSADMEQVSSANPHLLHRYQLLWWMQCCAHVHDCTLCEIAPTITGLLPGIRAKGEQSGTPKVARLVLPSGDAHGSVPLLPHRCPQVRGPPCSTAPASHPVLSTGARPPAPRGAPPAACRQADCAGQGREPQCSPSHRAPQHCSLARDSRVHPLVACDRGGTPAGRSAACPSAATNRRRGPPDKPSRSAHPAPARVQPRLSRCVLELRLLMPNHNAVDIDSCLVASPLKPWSA